MSNASEFDIARLTVTDLESVLRLQDDVIQSLGDQPWLRQNESDMFLDCLQNHVVIGASADGGLTATGIMVDVGQDHENIQHYLTDDVETIADSCNLKLVMVSPNVRRSGLARTLVERLHQSARERGRRHILCTIHPDNTPSQGLFTSLGYTRRAMVQTSYGQRLVFGFELD